MQRQSVATKIARGSSTLAELLRERAGEAPERAAYRFLGSAPDDIASITYGELDQNARRIGAWLQANGGEGERVLLGFPAGLDFIRALFGCLYAGAIPVPVAATRASARGGHIGRVFADAQAKFALTNRAVLAVVTEALPETAPAIIDIAGMDGMREPEWKPPRAGRSALAYLQYTSGSTLVPRGVMITHENVFENLSCIDAGFRHDSDSRVVSWLPHYHDMGLVYGILAPVYNAIPCILMSPTSFVQSPLRWLKAISESRATHSGGPNFAYDLCVNKIPAEDRSSLDLSSWRVAFNGAEPVRKQTLDRFFEVFGPCGFQYNAFYPAYGLAEATLKVSGPSGNCEEPRFRRLRPSALKSGRIEMCEDDERDAREVLSCGVTGGGATIAIVDPVTLQEFASAEVGEILVSGPSVASGYWNNPTETMATFGVRVPGRGGVPFLRTGDLGFVFDGELYPTGRIKELLIVRGANYYPHDLEAAIDCCHPALQPGGVAACGIEAAGSEKLAIVAELRDSVAADTDAVAASVRSILADQCQLEVQTVAFVKRGDLPRTTSGKLQRLLCRERLMAGTLNPVAVSTLAGDAPPSVRLEFLDVAPAERPRWIEQYLTVLLASHLGTDNSRIDRNSPIVALGIDSLAAAALQQRVEAELGIAAVQAVDLLDGTSIADLAPRMAMNFQDAPGKQASQQMPPASTGALSFEQERLWFLNRVSSNSSAYHLFGAILFPESPNLRALEMALEEIVRRHEPLRTVFTGQEHPLATLAPATTVRLPVVDLRDLASNDADASIQTLTRQLSSVPFDLTRPLVRWAIAELSERESALLLSMHHLIADAQSFQIMAYELGAVYESIAHGKPLPLAPATMSYSSFVRWQRESPDDGTAADALRWWQDLLSPEWPVLELPAARPRPRSRPYRALAERFMLPKELARAVDEFSRGERVTPFMTLLTACAAVLREWSGNSDLVIGCPTHGRPLPETRGLVGLFAYPLPFRIATHAEETLRDLLGRVRNLSLGVYSHSGTPLLSAVEHSRATKVAKDAPLLPVLFNFMARDSRATDPAWPRLESRIFYSAGTDVDLTVSITESEKGYEGSLVYNADMLDASAIRWFGSSFVHVLETLTQQPHRILANLDLEPLLDKDSKPASKDALRIAIASTFTAQPLAPSLAYWMKQLDIGAEIHFSPFGRVFQELLDPASSMGCNRGVNVILLRLTDWIAGGVADSVIADAQAYGELAQKVLEVADAIARSMARSGVPHVVICGPPPASTNPAARAKLTELEEQLRDACQPSGAQVTCSDALLETYPVSSYDDAYGDQLGSLAYTSAFFTALGTAIARRIFAVQSKPRKVVAVDCDQTLWDGVCAEDGPLGVQVSAARSTLQRKLKACRESGMLLCLCSRNQEEDVFRALEENPGMILSRGDFVAWRINWESKAENLSQLADELDLSLDSFIFLDDNPVECAEVRSRHPEVLTLQLPGDATRVPEFLQHVWALDPRPSTAEDLTRTEMYRQQRDRRFAQKAAASLDEFLTSLRVVVDMRPLSPDRVARASQLTFRTNQFNFAGIRRSEAEMAALLHAGDMECWTAEVEDRFGRYGVVGLIVFQEEPPRLAVDTFLLSCRALGKRVEDEMLRSLGQYAVEHSLETIDLHWIPSKRNIPALDFLRRVGSGYEQKTSRGFRYSLPAAGIPALLAARHESDRNPNRTMDESSSGGVLVASAVPSRLALDTLERIASDLHDPERTAAAIHADNIGGAIVSGNGSIPNTETERRIAEIWGELLEMPRVGIDEDFFALGGDSLLATRVLSRIHEVFDIEVPITVLFAEPLTVSRLASSLDEYRAEPRAFAAGFLEDQHVEAGSAAEGRGGNLHG
jgi:FkbH-like protein